MLQQHRRSRLVKPPLATARAAAMGMSVYLFVCLFVSQFVSLCVAKMQNAIFSETEQFRATVCIDDL